MAKAILTFIDDGDDRVEVGLEFDPPPSTDGSLTGAQKRALSALRGARMQFRQEDLDYAASLLERDGDE